jgi:endo-1,4-beta-xylanase
MVSAVPASATEAPTTLGQAAQLGGLNFGVAVATRGLADAEYTGLVEGEFTSITPEAELKRDTVEWNRGVYNFARADRILATFPGHQVRGSTLVWHSQQPAWLQSLSNPDLLRSATTDYINAVMGHYRGKIKTWDVVSEAFQNASGVRRESNFQRVLGNGYIEEFFRVARAADPDAALCYNDFGIEDFDHPKTQGVYDMVRDFVARGVPIDCVGFETHINSVWPLPTDYRRTLEEFAALGVDVQITELDITGNSDQPENYAAVTRACLAVPRCSGITVWGLRDSDTFRSNDNPLLFDRNGQKKPAYDAVLAALRTGRPATSD